MKTCASIRVVVLASSFIGSAAGVSFAQTAEWKTSPATPLAASAPTVVPALVPYSGIAVGGDGRALSGEVGVTFLIYKDEQGGEPLFAETQSVALDPTGHYTAQLGASLANGIPINLFGTGEARWLEVQIAGQAPQPRVLLASVPYAMKASDAATLGGLPASAFVLAGSTGTSVVAAAPPAAAVDVTTAGGISGYLAEFSGASSIVDSPLFVSGAKVGIGTAAPLETLDVRGTAISSGLIVNGVTTLGGSLEMAPVSFNATPATGYNSQLLKLVGSAYDSASKAIVNPRFVWQATVTGNNTAAPSATLNLLSATTAAVATSTGFSFNANGTINFAPQQTFPATSTSGVAVDGTSTSGVGVEGGSTSGTGVEGISGSGIGLVGNSTSNNGVQGTTGNVANTAGVYGVAGTPSGTGSGTVAGVWGDAMNHVGVAGTSAAFPGVAGSSTSGYGVQGTSKSSSGVVGKSGSVANTAGVYGVAAAASGIGVGTIAGVWGDAMNHVGVVGTSALFPGVDGGSTSGSGVLGNSTTPNEGQAGVLGTNGTAVSGTRATRAPNQVAGVWGDTTGNPQTGYAAGVIGTADNADGGSFFNNSALFATVYAENTGNGTGVSGTSDGTGIGVQGTGTTGISGYSPVSSGGIGVLAVVGGRSAEGTVIRSYFNVANWGDTNISAGYAVVGSADDGTSGAFFNNSVIYGALDAFNDTDSTTNPHSAAFEAGGSGGSCQIDVTGNLQCAGSIGDVAAVDSGVRQVETYSMQSAENWLEDFGSGQLSEGTVRINLDPTYAQTVNSGVEYHVFLTPKGDCKGLYVTNETAAGFDVREMGGGTSAVAFDYRIVAKRAGYENVRLADVTEEFKRRAEQHEKMRQPGVAIPQARPIAPGPVQPGTRNPLLHTAIPFTQPTVKTPSAKVVELR
jgi:hypothetical protein